MYRANTEKLQSVCEDSQTHLSLCYLYILCVARANTVCTDQPKNSNSPMSEHV